MKSTTSAPGQTKLQRVVSNLIALACGIDEYDEKGNLVKRDTGDLAAILAIFDRVEGRVPRQPSISSVNRSWQPRDCPDDTAVRDLMDRIHADLQGANRKSH